MEGLLEIVGFEVTTESRRQRVAHFGAVTFSFSVESPTIRKAATDEKASRHQDEEILAKQIKR